MEKPPSVINTSVQRIDEIKTTGGNAINFPNSAGVNLMNGLFTLNGGVYSQVEPGTAVGNVPGEQELTNQNNCRGTLYRVANTAVKGGTSRLEAHGNFTSTTGKNLKLTWKLGNHVLGTTGAMNMKRDHINEGWHLTLIWVVREIGPQGTAILSTTGFMKWLERTGAEAEHYELNHINNTQYETVNTETFSLVAEWDGGTNASDTITLENCIITKLF